jgi:hypothetical protein
LPEEDGGIETVNLSERAPSSHPVENLSQDPVLITWLPDHLPDSLRHILQVYGIPQQAIRGGCLLTRGHMEFQWMLELSLELTSEEGEGILGAMYPNAWNQYLGNLADLVWQRILEEEATRDIEWDK